MDSSKTIRFLLLGMLVCLGTTSCKPLDSQAMTEKTRSDGSKRAVEEENRRVLSQEEIVEAANAAVRQHGFNLAEYDAVYDKGNVIWRYVASSLSSPIIVNRHPVWPEGSFEASVRRNWPDLEKHDYQAVCYRHKPPTEPWPWGIYGRVLVLIDGNTGEVLLVFKEDA